MKRIHKDNNAPKYYSGKWSWDTKNDCLHFEQQNDLESAKERYITTNGYKFLRTINQEEELTFRQDYVPLARSFDSDTVVINDILNLVLFLMPSEFLTSNFVQFMYTPPVHRLIHALIIYFEYFLRLVEFVLIRRDELSGQKAQMQSEESNETKRIFSIYLSQYRLLVARNYSVILKGEGTMGKFYHMKEIANISATIKDKIFHEQFLSVAIQVIWICMHRRAYYVIEMEMNRLFRSEHFVMSRPEYLKYTPAEKSFLYGRHNKIVNYRTQISPLVQELKYISKKDLPILWIGERKYRGTDTRICELELEYIVPGPQLQMIDVSHGILGHRKRLYNTILELDWPTVRYRNFSQQYDPFHIVRQPHLDIPKIDAMKLRNMAEHFEHYYKVFRIYEPCTTQTVSKWLRREKMIQLYRSGGLMTSITSRCNKELDDNSTMIKPNQIVSKYFKVKSRLRNISTPTSQQDSACSYIKKAPTKVDDHFFEV